MMHSKPRKTSSLVTVPTLVLLALSVTGCAQTSPVCPPVSQPLPAPPLMSTPLPSQSYSSSAQNDIAEWRERLTGTQLMQER